MSEQCSSFEWIMFRFLVNNVKFMSEQYSIFEWIAQVMSEQCWVL